MQTEQKYTCQTCDRTFSAIEHSHSNDENKCILHCNKDTWYQTEDDRKDWKKSKNKITFFWQRVRHIIENRDQDEDYRRGASLDFTYTIFPKFEELDSEVEECEDRVEYISWNHNFCNANIVVDNSPAYNLNIKFNFRDAVFLDDADFKYYKFEDIVSFDNVQFKDMCIFQNTTFVSVSFQNVNFFKKVLFDNANVNLHSYQSSDFEDSVFHDELVFKGSRIGKEDSKKEFDISFKATTFKRIYFASCTFYQGIRFLKDTQAEYLNIQNINLNKLYIAGSIPSIIINGNGKTINSLIIKHNNLKNLIIHNTIVKDDFLLNDKQYRKNDEFKLDLLNFKESTFERKVKIQFYDITKANFYNTKFNDLADFYQTKFFEVNFERTDFKNISVFSEAEFYCDVDFKYTKFLSKSIFRDTLITGYLNLRDSIFDDEANFLYITSKSRKIFDKDENKYVLMGEPKDIKVSNRETARIIKNFYDNSNNIIEANRFYKLEMEEKEKELNKTVKSHFLEWFIFKTHAISSNHSQNWFLALFWIISITFIYSHIRTFLDHTKSEYFAIPLLLNFIILSFSFLKILIYKSLSLLEIILILIVSYFTYNITANDYSLERFSNHLNPFSIMSGSDHLDFFGLIYKVLIAYLIYQLIISVRQNTRRK